MRPRALLFDLDGTLVDSHREISLALQRALREAGVERDLAQTMRLVDGSPLPAIWEAVDAPTSCDYEFFAHSYRTHYLRDLGKHCDLFPGVEATLEALRARLFDVRLGVVSNKAAGTVQPLLEALGIAPLFGVALGSGGTSMRPKPDPESLLIAASKLGCEPRECAMIGDTVFDVEAGLAAGMYTVALTYGMGPRERLRACRPHRLLDTFEALLGVFDVDASKVP